jgi:hypothetical protein
MQLVKVVLSDGLSTINIGPDDWWKVRGLL